MVGMTSKYFPKISKMYLKSAIYIQNFEIFMIFSPRIVLQKTTLRKNLRDLIKVTTDKMNLK